MTYHPAMAFAELTIRDLGPKGDGVYEGPQGRVYVEGGLPGDQLEAKLRRDEAGITRGDIVRVVTPSAHRQEPPCKHAMKCGNCTLQHLQSDFYRRWKTELVREALQKQGLRPERWLEPVFLGKNNRRRANFSAFKRRDQVTFGYYRRRSQLLTDIDSCLVADPKILALRATLKPYLGSVLPQERPVDFFLQLVNGVADLVITGPVGRTGVPDKAVSDTLEPLLYLSPIVRISWRPHESENITTLLEKSEAVATFGALRVALPPAAFLQPTAEGERALVQAVMAAVPAKGKFADLFAGCGTFSGPLLARGPVDAFESVAPAVAALAKAARGKPLQSIRRDLFKNPLMREELNRYDAVVFDPPRAGCPEQAAAMASAKTPTLVGVSCNPATFARDARLLKQGGYRLESLQVVDQFLWSHHVEVVGVFRRS